MVSFYNSSDDMKDLVKYFIIGCKELFSNKVLIISLSIMNLFLISGIIYKEKTNTKRVMFMDNKKYKEKVEIQEKIRRVNGAMAQEGMPLTKDIKKKLYNCIIGKTTTTKERKKVIEKYRGIYG